MPSDDETLHLWELTTGRTLRVLRGRYVTDVFALDRDRALSMSSDNTLRLWDLTDGRVVSVIASRSIVRT